MQKLKTQLKKVKRQKSNVIILLAVSRSKYLFSFLLLSCFIKFHFCFLKLFFFYFLNVMLFCHLFLLFTMIVVFNMFLRLVIRQCDMHFRAPVLFV